MNIVSATHAYETWMRKHLTPIRADLDRKHADMAEAAFPFLRATYYRWAATWAGICLKPAKAPRVLAVGDLHVENFATWRDSEGRLVWGIDDFDEAFLLPYTNDLVRLATSAILAIGENRLAIAPGMACDAILDGYREGIKHPRPFLLAERHAALRTMELGAERDPVRFWPRLTDLDPVRAPASVHAILRAALPPRSKIDKIVHRAAGVGSLGRPRFAAVAECDGGLVAREVKMMLPPAAAWLGGKHQTSRYRELLSRAIRARDPFVKLVRGWVVRRLAPDCSSIELDDLPTRRDERRLLQAMGFETANVHAGTKAARDDVRRHLKRAGKHWLRDAAEDMAEATRKDWRKWREAWRG